MSLKSLQEYTFTSRYARYLKDKKKRETWSESVNRSRTMMLEKYKDFPEAHPDIEWAYDMMKKKRVLGSQRAMQFGGKPILDKNMRMYNCISSYCDRVKFFQECMWLLLCGCGTGFSVQKHHIEKLPKLLSERDGYKKFVIEDTIEGWADAIGVLVSSYFKQSDLFQEYNGHKITFDYSKIRVAGSELSYGGKAPGPEPLKIALNKIRDLLDKALENKQSKLRPIQAYDIIMYSADAVISGGVRRSATIALFSEDDSEMMTSKTGNWFNENPQRGRSNNSVVLLKNELTKEKLSGIIENIKQYGEPGFCLVNNLEHLVNPCQPGNAPLITRDGLTLLKDLRIGDEIWSTTGWTKIVNKIWTGAKPVYKYKTTAGYFLGTDTHRVVQHGEKIEVVDCDSIDIITGPYSSDIEINPKVVMDGLVFGDGSVHAASNNLVYLIIGENDSDYFSSEISELILKSRPGIKEGSHEITTSILAEEIPLTFHRKVPYRFYTGDRNMVCSFLRGLYSANGSVVDGRVTLKASSFMVIEDVQCMLSSIGIRSYYTTNKAKLVQFENGEYECKESYDLNISTDRIKFRDCIGFIQEYKNIKLRAYIDKTRTSEPKKQSYDIIKREFVANECVYDITVDNESHTYWTGGCNVSNCVEISFYAYDSEEKSGWQACNLSTINGSKAKTKEEFFESCKAAAIIGTLQAGFTETGYLGKVSQDIIEREALLGVSITGIMDSPDICLNPELQREATEIIRLTNVDIAKKINIKPSARRTCVKPEGSSSCVLGTASGIHPHHAKRYIRRVQSNKQENVYKYFKNINPRACEDSVWSTNDTDGVISFCVEVPDGAKTKNQLGAIDLLRHVKSTQENWVEPGTSKELCTKDWLVHNVSNTINVKPEEWESVAQFIFDNKESFCGISLLPITGDKDYPQAPFTTIYQPTEMVKHYGDGIMFVSGLIGDSLELFEDNLWKASDFLLGIGEKPKGSAKKDFVERCKKFAGKYFGHDIRKLTYAMKDVYNYKLWTELKQEYKDVDFSQMIEEEDQTKVNQEVACAGGTCELR